MQSIIVTVDVVLLCLKDDRLHVLLVRRSREPFIGQLALPGGYVHSDEDADTLSAARRVVLGKAGVHPPYLDQLYTFADSARDPRGWSVSIAYYALVSAQQLDALNGKEAQLVPIDALPRIAFDHNRIVEAAVERLRNKSAYSTLPCYLLPEQFTLPELQRCYERVMGVALERTAFRRKVLELDFVEPLSGALQVGGRHRPAQLYRLRPRMRMATFDSTL